MEVRAKDEAAAAGQPAESAKPDSKAQYNFTDPESKIDAYISTRKQTHGEPPGPCPRGPLPKNATIIDRMSRRLHTKAGATVYAARKGIVEPVIGQIK